MTPVSFFVPGVAAPKGSARAWRHPRTGAIITQQQNREKLIPWESRIASFAIQAGIKEPSEGPVRVLCVFNMQRPKNHFGAKGLKDKAPRHHIGKPDVDKLVRACLDALTGVAYVDDSQVVEATGAKIYATAGPGVHITIDSPPPPAVLLVSE